MYRIRKQLKFESAHRLISCYSECCSDTIHGHSYILELFFKTQELNEDGMIIDFGQVSMVTKKLLEKWDHSLILHKDDPIASMLLKNNKRVFVFSVNPTAENMSKILYDTLKIKFPELYKVRLHETATGWAEYEGA